LDGGGGFHPPLPPPAEARGSETGNSRGHGAPAAGAAAVQTGGSGTRPYHAAWDEA